jgi:hypothetical protein
VWAETNHLDHGGYAGQHIWYPRTAQNYRILAYIGRAMRWAATELGADGFRIDHALGLPFYFFEQTLPWGEMKIREDRGSDGHPILVLEDHDRKDYSARVGDVVQSTGHKWLPQALRDQDVDEVWRFYANPDVTAEFIGTGNHDEVPGSTFFNGDLLAYGNAVLTMLTMGGATTMLASDEYAESQQLRFKAKGGIPTLWQLRLRQLPPRTARSRTGSAGAEDSRSAIPPCAVRSANGCAPRTAVLGRVCSLAAGRAASPTTCRCSCSTTWIVAPGSPPPPTSAPAYVSGCSPGPMTATRSATWSRWIRTDSCGAAR